MDTPESVNLSLAALLERLAADRIGLVWDGRNVRARPAESVTAEVGAAIRRHRAALVWMLRNRLPVDETRPAWEFWFTGGSALVDLDFQILKWKGE